MKVERAARLLTSRAIMDGELHLLSCSSFESSPSRIAVTQKWLGAFADYHVAVQCDHWHRNGDRRVA